MVPIDATDPRQYAKKNEKSLQINDLALADRVKKITYPEQDFRMNDTDKIDLQEHLKTSNKYHSLLGQNQHALRNKDTIKMSSSSSSVNIYKNIESRDLLN